MMNIFHTYGKVIKPVLAKVGSHSKLKFMNMYLTLFLIILGNPYFSLKFSF